MLPRGRWRCRLEVGGDAARLHSSGRLHPTHHRTTSMFFRCQPFRTERAKGSFSSPRPGRRLGVPNWVMRARERAPPRTAAGTSHCIVTSPTLKLHRTQHLATGKKWAGPNLPAWRMDPRPLHGAPLLGMSLGLLTRQSGSNVSACGSNPQAETPQLGGLTAKLRHWILHNSIAARATKYRASPQRSNPTRRQATLAPHSATSGSPHNHLGRPPRKCLAEASPLRPAACEKCVSHT